MMNHFHQNYDKFGPKSFDEKFPENSLKDISSIPEQQTT
jgi:hypothetical protein